MVLISIIPGRNSRLVWLKFDNNRLLPANNDDVVRMSLTRGMAISLDILIKLEKASLSFMLEEYSLRQIAISPKIRSILIPKLKNYCRRISRKYSYPVDLHSETIENTISYLESRGYLNTIDYDEYYIKRHPKMSHAQITYSLRNLGIKDQPSFKGTFSDIDKIKKIYEKKYSKFDMSNFQTKIKVYSALSRRGFTVNNIKTAIDEYLKIR